jgi:hypothetical protein
MRKVADTRPPSDGQRERVRLGVAERFARGYSASGIAADFRGDGADGAELAASLAVARWFGDKWREGHRVTSPARKGTRRTRIL